MTIRTLGLASGITSLQDHRLALGAFMGPGASVLERRGGIYYYPGAADLVSASALQANVTPFVAIVDGTSNSLQGQITVVVDANETLTFSAGEAAVARTDRVILQIRDTAYDGSGSTDARVLVLKGNTSTGAATALPASSLLLWEVTVPIGASSITFSSARTDRRTWTATPLRIPVNSQTERDALPAIPGLEVTRLDTGNVEQFWSSAWRLLGPSAAPDRLLAYKSADTGRTSNIRVDDPHLTVNIAANTAYRFELFIGVSGSVATMAGSLEFSLGTMPSGASGYYRHMLPGSTPTLGTSPIVAAGSSIGFGTNSSNTPYTMMFEGVILNGANAGSVRMSWGNQGNVNTLTFLRGSYLLLEKIS
ncbi:hypothetical protein [Streptosporangium canum]|uniref:hypothetical protein n=1 Tax=Streptosporangium canum TaxID=324952 RepID=UPI0037992703